MKTTYAVDLMSFKRIAILAFVSAIFALVTGGCSTVKGFGRDVETVGESIEDSAQ